MDSSLDLQPLSEAVAQSLSSLSLSSLATSNSLDSDPSPSSTPATSGTSTPFEPPEPRKVLYPLPPQSRPLQVLPEDLKTPDSHVPRDPRLIRLTGIHPFNVEAPLTDLFNAGFLTPTSLHYVRNHGAVPFVPDSSILDWEVTVEGMVQHPMKLTLRELLDEFEQVTYPVTLVCAGNRRKEQNVVRKTKGFSWGAAGVSTALWTGVPLVEVLARAKPLRGARYVCFEGADALPNGHYGTSVRLSWAMDRQRGMLLAHGMNGEVLHPDHGKPLRVVIPGQIGGRSVKWLKRIIVTAQPSDNWYHIYDNRVLPTTIDPEQSANVPDVWRDERYAIYDLNTNSAVCVPAHEQRVTLAQQDGAFTLRGYAYAGGGRRVTRLEVTLDQGRSWKLAEIDYPEDAYRAVPDGETLFGGRIDVAARDTSFCWCFWRLALPLSELAAAGDVMVRAMDEALHVQPRDMYWSVLGMMNNPWYRVVIHREGDSLWFEHPVQPALMPGGWMERVKREGGDLANGFWGEKVPGSGGNGKIEEEKLVKEISMVNPDVKREITLEELHQHSGEEEPWFVVKGQVYDGTPFLRGHPGGAASIIHAAGQDVSEEFLAIHSENAKAMLPQYHIGYLSPSLSALSLPPSMSPSTPQTTFLSPTFWSHLILHSKTPISPDSTIFTFHFPPSHSHLPLGLPAGKHLLLRLRDPATREPIIRAYTPLSPSHNIGEVQILIKIYRPDAKKGYPTGGRMTTALESLPLGHPVETKGPVGGFEYRGRGRCVVHEAERRVKRLVMLAGGSGITPMWAVLRFVVEGMRRGEGGKRESEPESEPEPEPECVLVYANRTEGDILLRQALTQLEEQSRGRCRVVHILTQPGETWRGLKGEDKP
ncbi:nitrate reductase-like protein [Thermochaetoides thermophila DSM 1495]|uniref:Nitrate reductase n=1 Tax=Chaetomium thermophilum (strain DSM 1495 / CBS 144.50 / IMI 039719) TaxID=759272 RepID=G0S8H0_CHATD|nr:nitrate reductase-like protein [Thermochaetoides thermophila DSM 1495]EGS21144.1 nitrate reductase-like protein [Thermochaetoides thermophila DSM 1495]